MKVKWIDNSDAINGWEFLDELPPLKPATCHTIGYFLENNHEFITVASTISQTQVFRSHHHTEMCNSKS